MSTERLERMGVPPRYLSCARKTWQPLQSGDPWLHLDRWLGNRGRSWCVAILGPTGSGKSHLATALFREWLERCNWGTTGWWIDAATAMATLREELSLGPEVRRIRMREKLHDPRLLLLDDFLADRLTEFAHDEWTYALSQRYNNMLPTIITSNAESLDAFDALDPRITSRLHAGLVIRLGGRDRRARQRERQEVTA